MYWWRVSKLAEDLREGRVKEKDRLKYFLAMVLLWIPLTQPFLYYGSAFKITDVVNAALVIATTITGTILCYRANRSGDNGDFIGRMVCLSWPIGIKVLVLGLVAALIAIPLIDIVGKAMGGTSEQIDTAGDVGLVVELLAFGILYYWLLYKYVRLVAQPKEAA